MAKETKNQDYIVYFVPHRKDAFWIRIGAAWNHNDGKGLNIETDFMPVGDGRIVLRDFSEAPKDESKEATGDGGSVADRRAGYDVGAGTDHRCL
jgi:hypothetical protein